MVELSIVLVIIGLVIGGVLVGQDLILAARLKKLAGTLQSYDLAIGTFKTKFNNNLPGDHPSITQFLGTAAGCPAAGTTTQATCDGDGNRILENGEPLWAWQQLAATGLIPGQYTGIWYGGGQPAIQVGVNSPPLADFNATCYFTYFSDVDWGVGSYFPHYRQNVLFCGSYVDDVNFWYNNFLNPPEGYAVDVKIDDGKPGTGVIRNYKSCATTLDPLTAEYNLDDTNRYCALLQLMGTP